ncbi:AAA family ATPase [Salmonella enterica]|nr:AAA family ATPase [Salmonella enterica]
MSDIDNAPQMAQETAQKSTKPAMKLRIRQKGTLPESENFLVKGILPRRGIGIIYAPSGTGKTFTGISLAGAIAANRGHWLGQFAAMGSVIYVSYESGAGFDQRLRAVELEMNNGAPIDNLVVIEGGLTIGEPESMQALHGLVKHINHKRPHAPVRTIIIDTVSQSMGGGDDSYKADDVREYLKHYNELAYAFNLCVIGMAHPGKDLSRGVSGSLVWRNNVDFLILMTRPVGSYEVKFTFDKLRDADRDPIFCKLRKVPYEQSLIDVLEANHAAEKELRGGLELPAYDDAARLASYSTLILEDAPYQPARQMSVTERDYPDFEQLSQNQLLLYLLGRRGGCELVDVLRDDYKSAVEKMGKSSNKMNFARAVNYLLGKVNAKNPQIVQVKQGETVWLSLPGAVNMVGKKPEEDTEE